MQLEIDLLCFMTKQSTSAFVEFVCVYLYISL